MSERTQGETTPNIEDNNKDGSTKEETKKQGSTKSINDEGGKQSEEDKQESDAVNSQQNVQISEQDDGNTVNESEQPGKTVAPLDVEGYGIDTQNNSEYTEQCKLHLSNLTQFLLYTSLKQQALNQQVNGGSYDQVASRLRNQPRTE